MENGTRILTRNAFQHLIRWKNFYGWTGAGAGKETFAEEFSSAMVCRCSPMNTAIKAHWATNAAPQIAGRKTHAPWSNKYAAEGTKNAEKGVRSAFV